MYGMGKDGVSSPQRLMQMIPMKKTGLGTAALSGSGANFASIVKNGTGDYTITLKSGVVFTQIPEVTLGPKTVGILKIHAVTISTVQIKCYLVDGTTAQDMDFDLNLIGSLARDLVGP